MLRPTIVIVDSGLKKDHTKLKNDDLNEITFGSTKADSIYGHGTAIYGIIRKCLSFATIINIKVQDIEKGVSEKLLVDVLTYIHNNIQADIINLSLGITILQEKDTLKSICDTLIEKGVIIVAAFDNSGSISYPAAFENVIGVISSAHCKTVDQFEYFEDEIVNIAAKGDIQRVLWDSPEFLILGGNSFACAHTTVQVAKYMAEGFVTRAAILNQFKSASIQIHQLEINNNEYKMPFTIQKASLFPFNKEMHSLIRYSNLLPFEIKSIYDSKYSARVGARTNLLMNDAKVKSLVIKNIKNINWDEFDTLIIGHIEDLSEIINDSGLVENIIEQAISLNKNIYVFDDLTIDSDYPNIYIPRVTKEDLPPDRCGMLYRISKPVLSVMGTSSKQGKFTLQLKIRELLLNEGYAVGQVGTEPSALLYGMDYVYPMGYHSSVYIHEQDAIRYLNYIMNRLCDKDIILVGSQSGSVPFDVGNLSQFTVSQYLFLAGTQPDAVVLCINPFDDYEYIQRSVRFIESCADCKVISIVVFPMDLKENWTGIYGQKIKLDKEKFNSLKTDLYQLFSVPIYQLGQEEDMRSLLNTIINFFSEN